MAELIPQVLLICSHPDFSRDTHKPQIRNNRCRIKPSYKLRWQGYRRNETANLPNADSNPLTVTSD